MTYEVNIMDSFLKTSQYINFENYAIYKKAKELFNLVNNDVEKAKIAYQFVRDEIMHTFDFKKNIITSSASEVLEMRTGICHAKSNLLAALLRSQGIPTGFCYQHITLGDTDKQGYCLHCYNAILLNGKWVKVDARGNTNKINAQFSLNQPKLAFPIRKEYDEYFIKGIYATPHFETMQLLNKSYTIEEVIKNIPCERNDLPEIQE